MIPIMMNNPAINQKVIESAGANVIYGENGNIFDRLSSTADSLIDKGKNALSDVLSSVGKVVDKYAPSILAGLAGVQYRGTQGSFQSFTIPIRLTCRIYHVTSADRNAEIGHPTHQHGTLSTYYGFVLCENAKVPLTTTMTEQIAVEEFLNSGVYLE